MDFLENFVSIMLYTLWIMVMISFFVIVIRIIMDVFRDRDLSGWGKAGWLIFIALVPVLGSIVYLLARGKGMAQRDVAAAQAIRREAEPASEFDIREFHDQVLRHGMVPLTTLRTLVLG